MKYEDAIIDAIIDEISSLKNELFVVKRRLDLLQEYVMNPKEIPLDQKEELKNEN